MGSPWPATTFWSLLTLFDPRPDALSVYRVDIWPDAWPNDSDEVVWQGKPPCVTASSVGTAVVSRRMRVIRSSRAGRASDNDGSTRRTSRGRHRASITRPSPCGVVHCVHPVQKQCTNGRRRTPEFACSSTGTSSANGCWVYRRNRTVEGYPLAGAESRHPARLNRRAPGSAHSPVHRAPRRTAAAPASGTVRPPLRIFCGPLLTVVLPK